MEVIATSLKDVFVSGEPWVEAHKLWFKRKAEELDDPNIETYAEKPDYFRFLDTIMKLQYPTRSEEERTKMARKEFFESVLHYIEHHPEVKKQEAIDAFTELKKTHKLVLITTNTKDATHQILGLLGVKDFFDEEYCSKDEEKDDKVAVFQRCLHDHTVKAYVGSDSSHARLFCAEHNIPFILFEGKESITSSLQD